MDHTTCPGPDAIPTPAPKDRHLWARLYRRPRLDLAVSAALPYLAYRVLDVLICTCDRKGHWHGTQSELADLMGSTQPSISAALARLAAAGHIIRGGRHCYRISPAVMEPMGAPRRRA